MLALEKAMGKKCNPSVIGALGNVIIKDSAIEYLQNKTIVCDGKSCVIDTEFDVEHTEPLLALNGIEWHGVLPDKHEYLCIILRN